LFATENKTDDDWLATYKEKLKQFAEQDCIFCSNSNYVRKMHTLKYVENIKDENTKFVYIPVNKPNNIEFNLLTQRGILHKYNITDEYIYYPTQIRPYKNILTLLKVVKILLNNNIHVQLVLTGNPNDSPLLKRYIKDNDDLKEKIVLTGDVPEIDLYSLHKYALATVVPTLFEGGFPWQGLEAMLMDTPAIMSKIPVVIERLQYAGIDPDNCGLKLFEPEDYIKLADIIIDVMKDRQKVVKDQQYVKDKLFKYTWDDTSRAYYKILTDYVVGQGNNQSK
jgi:glycosyltransferase involved in cell wall biosynthesis